MTAQHSLYEDLAAQRRGSTEYREGYAEARRAFLIGQAVRERRLALGLSQTELARRAGMTQPALSRLEAGGVVPTIPLLERISTALDADLIVELAPTPPDHSTARDPATPCHADVSTWPERPDLDEYSGRASVSACHGICRFVVREQTSPGLRRQPAGARAGDRRRRS
jgi:transcriptional regulator with XRE-family HTH domain